MNSKMEELEPELKPCPFCGAKAVITTTLGKPGWQAQCSRRHEGCHVNMRTHKHEFMMDAFTAWNTRHNGETDND